MLCYVMLCIKSDLLFVCWNIHHVSIKHTMNNHEHTARNVYDMWYINGSNQRGMSYIQQSAVAGLGCPIFSIIEVFAMLTDLALLTIP